MPATDAHGQSRRSVGPTRPVVLRRANGHVQVLVDCYFYTFWMDVSEFKTFNVAPPSLPIPIPTPPGNAPRPPTPVSFWRQPCLLMSGARRDRPRVDVKAPQPRVDAQAPQPCFDA